MFYPHTHTPHLSKIGFNPRSKFLVLAQVPALMIKVSICVEQKDTEICIDFQIMKRPKWLQRTSQIGYLKLSKLMFEEEFFIFS